MTDHGAAAVEAALSLVGCRFRLHGRDPASGLDCVGLVSFVLAAAGKRPIVPTGYGLRNMAIEHWLPFAQRSGLVPASEPVQPAQVLLLGLTRCQHHLAITVGSTEVVHAHAGLRCVVRQPLDPVWNIISKWHIARNEED